MAALPRYVFLTPLQPPHARVVCSAPRGRECRAAFQHSLYVCGPAEIFIGAELLCDSASGGACQLLSGLAGRRH